MSLSPARSDNDRVLNNDFIITVFRNLGIEPTFREGGHPLQEAQELSVLSVHLG